MLLGFVQPLSMSICPLQRAHCDKKQAHRNICERPVFSLNPVPMNLCLQVQN